MNFNQIILKKLGFLFDKYDLHIIEQRHNYLKLQLKNLEFVFAHNQLEKSNSFFLSKKGESHTIDINDNILKLFFNSDLKFNCSPIDIFANNLVIFFENVGMPLLIDDLNKINELDKFVLERNRLYTEDLLEEQILMSANNAWDKGNYKKFVDLIDQTNKGKLLSSYQLKYKIAIKNLEK